MKLKQILFLILFLSMGSVICHIHAQSVSLEIEKRDDSKLSVGLNSLTKITFSDSDLVLNYHTGLTENVHLADIEKMIFGVISGLKNPSLNRVSVSVYPNPASNSISFSNLKSGINQISVYSINGVELINEILPANQNTINISKLDMGLYFVKIDNQVAKFTKR